MEEVAITIKYQQYRESESLWVFKVSQQIKVFVLPAVV